MKRAAKAARMSAAAFLNAVRLHRDAVMLYDTGRYPSAFQLSVLSQEEIGKCFLLEEFVFRVAAKYPDPADSRRLLAAIVSHRWKQLWFAKQEVDMSLHPLSREEMRFFTEAQSGVLEKRKQDATYVGLTRTLMGRPDGNGRILVPASRVGQRHAAEQITRVGDVFAWLVHGYLDNVLVMDTEDLEACLSPQLAAELDDLWPGKNGLQNG